MKSAPDFQRWTAQSPPPGFADATVDAMLAPKGKAERRKWLGETWKPLWSGIAQKYRDKLIELYGPERAARVKFAEAFEGCEYGSRLTRENMKELFPFF